MTIIYNKSTMIRGKRWPVKTIMRVTQRKGQQLVSAGIANEYRGTYPPPLGKKVKFDLKHLKV